MRQRLRSTIAVSVGITVALLMSACSSSSSSNTPPNSGPSSSSASTSAIVAEAKQAVQKATNVQGQLALPVLSKAPAPGKTIGLITCGVPACQQNNQQAEQALKLLGWNFKPILSQFTPQSFQAAIETAVQDKVDGLIVDFFFPPSIVKAQLEAAKNAGIVVVATGVGQVEYGGDQPIQAVTQGQVGQQAIGKLQAQVIIADSNGNPGTVAYVRDPEVPFYVNLSDGFQAEMQKAGIKTSMVNVSQGDPTSQIVSQVVSFAQKTPSLRYITGGISEPLLTGVPQGLKGASITDVKIVGASPEQSDIQDIKNGTQLAAVDFDNDLAIWLSVYQLTAIIGGDPLAPDLRNPIGLHRVVTNSVAQTLTDDTLPPTPGIPDVFKAAWHIS
jgi:ABC-type sugar transport system substrate-binding protein